VREFFKQRFTVDELRSILNQVGMEPHELLSTRSRPYQALHLADREVDEEELLALMVEHPALIRRPLTVRSRRAVVGFDKHGLEEIATCE
jgi:arsenate reductase